jgi:flavodoxin
LVAYFSEFGNNQKIAEAIAEVLASKGLVRMINMGRLGVCELTEIDLVVMGMPTHRINLPEAV